MKNYFIVALVVIGAIFAGFTYTLSQRLVAEQKRTTQLEAAVRQYAGVIESQELAKKRSDAALTGRLRAAEALAKQRKEEHEALQKVLDTARDWSVQPAPAAVVDWLRSPGT